MSVSDLMGRLNLGCKEERTGLVSLPRFILMTDDMRLPDPLPAVEALPEKSAVIFRHYDAPDREGLAAGLLARARRSRVRVLISPIRGWP